MIDRPKILFNVPTTRPTSRYNNVAIEQLAYFSFYNFPPPPRTRNNNNDIWIARVVLRVDATTAVTAGE